MDAIASTIITRIISLDGYALFDFQAKKIKSIPAINFYKGGISFEFKGPQREGFVVIMLTYFETYDLQFFNKNGDLLKEVKEVIYNFLAIELHFIMGVSYFTGFDFGFPSKEL